MDPAARLLARDQHGIKFGLDNIRALCTALDHPELASPALLIAGTNGKGSVTAMTAAAMSAAGHRTGRYTSPHLVRVEERFVVDGKPIAAPVLSAAIDRVTDAESRAIRRGDLAGPVTFFEITTAVAFEAFRLSRVDVMVLEVGMGGRFDATNVSRPVVTAITSIDFDHTRFLGRTLPEIAFEKAGIVRAGCPVVAGPLPAEAAAVVRAAAAARGAPYVEARMGVETWTSLAEDGRTQLRLTTPAHEYGQVTLALRGRHQVANAVVATRVLEAADAAGLHVGTNALRTGLSTTVWPARLQELTTAGGVRVLLDAAHNPSGATALADYVRDVAAPPATIVFGAMRDKDVAGMLRALAPIASHFVFTAAASPRAMSTEALVDIWTTLGLTTPVTATHSTGDAFDLAARTSAFVIVAGSMFVIGELLPLLSPPSPDDAERCGILPARRG